jgi:hypothetical protein
MRATRAGVFAGALRVLPLRAARGVYAPRPDGGLRFSRVKAPEREELEHLVQQIAERVGRALERMGLLQRDAESVWLDLPPGEDTDAMRQLIGSSVTYRIAVGPQAGRKALVLRTIRALPGEEPRNEVVAKANGFSLHAGVSCEAHQRDLRERLCRYVAAARGGRETAHGECAGEGGVPAQDAVPGRDDACALRAARLYRPACSAGAAPAREPHPLSRCAGAEPPLACGGDAGRKGQGDGGGCSAREIRDRAACGDERWAQRLKRVFRIDVESRVRCGKSVRVAAPAHPCARGISASLHVIASIEEPGRIERILAHVRGTGENSDASLV